MKYKISSLKLSKPLRFFIGLVLIFAIGAVSTSKLSAKPKTSVILVHGTLGDNHSWGSPKKGFHKAIEQNFNSPAEFEVIPFGWSGRLSSKTRLEAAGQLSELILKLSPTNKVVTIGHSHGGTIINLASQILEICSLADPAQIENQINSLILNLESISAKENELALKVINQPFITKKGLNSVAKFFSNKVIPKAEKLTKNKETPKWLVSKVRAPVDTVQELISDSQKSSEERHLSLVTQTESIVQKLIVKNETALKKPDFLISQNFLLGTPINEEFLIPSRTIVGTTYSFYTLGDVKGQAFGVSKQAFSNNVPIQNISVFIQNPLFIYKPIHEGLHNACIGRWILRIPELIKNKGKNLKCIFFTDGSRPEISENSDKATKDAKPPRHVEFANPIE